MQDNGFVQLRAGGVFGWCVRSSQTFSSHQTSQAPVPDSQVSHSLIILTFLHNDPMHSFPFTLLTSSVCLIYAFLSVFPFFLRFVSTSNGISIFKPLNPQLPQTIAVLQKLNIFNLCWFPLIRLQHSRLAWNNKGSGFKIASVAGFTVENQN